MFRRQKPEPEPETSTTPADEGVTGKGRPTPKRRDAEAAAKARAKAPRTRKEQAAARREQRAKANERVREAMRTGDDKNLPARDKGPVRRFIRDFVDVRLSYVELLLPLLVIYLVLGWTGSTAAAGWANAVLLALLLLVAIDLVIMRFRLRRELTRRFPDAPLKGTTSYAVTRSLQMKFMRLPKAQVKMGQKLPERYT
ncbi:DUF3043 domain-containing protein [Nocardioides rotundus]|uniref:DUF3043 domain-containing protein n=1 Tax=Nocardioides rotundus TaxID=1774216 RepID=UPI001CBD9704|nr:DUF3043 domain-containing protein [Nocardioides rotundus]